MVHSRKKSVKRFVPLFFAFCFLLLASSTRASVLFFEPQAGGTVENGESFVASVYLDTEGQGVNALDVSVRFPADRLEVLDVSRGNSVLTLWIQDPSFDNEAGLVHFVGGIPGGGLFKTGLVGQITFRTKTEGQATLGWDGSSMVLLHDGRGTQDSVTFLDTTFEVTPEAADVPRVASRTHPDQARWYNDSRLVVGWKLADGAVYSYALDHDPRLIPDETPDTPQGDLAFLGDIKYEALADGVYYFHLREGRYQELEVYSHAKTLMWGRTRTFRAQIDTASPESLDASIGRDPSVFGGKLFVSFAATDGTSGVDRYEVWERSLGWQAAKSPYELRDRGRTGPIKVRVFDKAGNTTERELFPPKAPLPVGYFVMLAGALALFAAAWFLRRRLGKNQ